MDLIDAFTEHYLALHLAACSTTGVSDEQISKAAEALRKVADAYADSASLPKSLVNVLIDMTSALMSTADRHGEDMQQKIYLAADELADIAREMTL